METNNLKNSNDNGRQHHIISSSVNDSAFPMYPINVMTPILAEPTTKMKEFLPANDDHPPSRVTPDSSSISTTSMTASTVEFTFRLTLVHWFWIFVFEYLTRRISLCWSPFSPLKDQNTKLTTNMSFLKILVCCSTSAMIVVGKIEWMEHSQTLEEIEKTIIKKHCFFP